MNKMEKKAYSQPQSAVTRVELESPICSGSVVVQNPATDYKIENQTVNDGFQGDFSGQTWDSSTNNN